MIPLLDRLTGEQRAAALASEPAVAVAAGAGTGKTRVLTARYLDLLLAKGVDPARILAVTFTEKAAREMKERIRSELRAAGRPDLAQRAEFAPISTVHALLARLLRERALDAGLDPRFALADEGLSDQILEEALHETVDGMPAAARAALSEVSGAEDALLDLHQAARATPFEMSDLVAMPYDPEPLRRATVAFLDACAERTSAAAGTARRLQGLRALRKRLEALDPGAAEPFAELVGGVVSKDLKELFDRGKALREEWRSLPLLDRSRAAGAALREALVRLDAAYTAKKRADALLDFPDLEREGLRLLRTPAGAEAAREFDHLLVDEYQDTSRIQEAILDALALGRTRFGVGDEKQSIYRFRHADASVFRRLLRSAPRRALEGSFRSRPELVSFANALFRNLFQGSAVEPQDLRAEARFRPKSASSVELLLPGARNAADGRRREAILLARRLREIVEEKALRITRAEEEDRPLAYGDCAILLRTTTGLSVYERALAQAGVPYVVVKGRGYYAAREVVDLAHLLLLLANPEEPFYRAAVLTSLLCGVPDGDLLHLRDRTLPFGPPGPPGIPLDRWERLLAFSRRFESWRGDLRRVPSGDLVERILEETRFADLLLLEPDGRRRHANLMKALRRARRSGEDPEVLARELLEFRERERRESEAPIAAEGDDAVRILTVHAAKGLEFPLVAVADLTSERGGKSKPIVRPDGTFGFRLEGEEAPPGLAPLKEAEEREEGEERLRLLYVALTRAEEHLILSGSLSPRADRSVVDLLLADETVGKVTPPEGDRLSPPRPARYSGAVRGALRRAAPLPPELPRDEAGARALLARIDALRPREPDATPYVVAAADLVEFERCPRRYRLVRMLGIDLDAGPDGTGEGAGGGERPARSLGSAFHAILADLGPLASPSDSDIGKRLPDATGAERARIRRWCAWLSAQPLAREASAVPNEREMAFLVRIAGIAVRGVIDLYAAGLPLLADWKTSREADPEEYATQMSVYLAALPAMGLPAPSAATLFYVEAERIAEVRPRPLEPVVRAFREAHRGAGAFPPRRGGACLRCPFRNVCEAG